MKGHMQDGKFHPHTDYKKVRKSRDQSVKTKGIKIRKQRDQASIDSRLLSHHFGSNDINANGDRNYTIQFGKKGYDLITNRMIDNFENNYPEAKLEFIPKDKILKVKFNGSMRKARNQSNKFVGIKIHPDKRAEEQLKGAPQTIKVCSTCDRSFDISKQKGNKFFDLPQCDNCKRRGVPPL